MQQVQLIIAAADTIDTGTPDPFITFSVPFSLYLFDHKSNTVSLFCLVSQSFVSSVHTHNIIWFAYLRFIQIQYAQENQKNLYVRVCVCLFELSPFLVTHPRSLWVWAWHGVLCKAVHWCDVERMSTCVILRHLYCITDLSVFSGGWLAGWLP